MKTGACQFLGSWDEFQKNPDFLLCNTVLPLSVERGKPRVCQDGGCLKSISPEKIDCSLDEVVKAIQMSKKDTLYMKYDDCNGTVYRLLNIS